MAPLKKFAQAGTTGGSLSRRLPFVTPGATQRLWLCRHGETAGNAHQLVQGAGIDLPLNEVGKKQADELGKALAAFQFDVIASSDLVRAVETAAAIAAYHPPTYYGAVDPDLREMGFGDLEGQRIAAVKESGAMAATQDQWETGDLSVRWPGIGGESPEQVATRGTRGLLALLAADPQPANVLVVAHGRLNKYVLSSLLHGDASRWEDYPQDNTCVNVLERTRTDASTTGSGVFKGQPWSKLVLNDTSHLT